MSDTIAIRLENLSKTFGRRKRRVRAVETINLQIEAGQVYGFLGPNGAGKSTTIRLIMDLIRPTRGDVYVYGRHVRREHDVLRRAGALVEGAMFYDFLTGRKNLEVLARTGNCYDDGRIQVLLEQVGMAGQADRRVQGYSTGMKQRLGLAAALLNDPDLVILDEPTGGLDPAGIQEMRYFIRDLVDRQDKTVFLSSHLLGEVEQVCDRVAIIHNGEIVREGAVAELLAEQFRIGVEAKPLDTAMAILLQSGWTVHKNGAWLMVDAPHAQAPDIVRRLVTQDVHVYQVTAQRQSLEEYFMAATATVTED